MPLRLVIASLLSAGAQAFAPAPIRWGGAVDKLFVLAPASRGSSTVHGPQQLTIRDQTGVIYGTDIPHFTAKPDKTIEWDGKGLCIEASGAASGDMVQLNICTGEATQTWNWLPWGPLQLRGTNRCFDAIHNGDLNGSPIELRECEDGITDSWAFDDSVPLATPSPVSYFESSHHVIMSLIVLAVLSFFGLGAHLYRLRQKAGSFATSQGRLLEVPSVPAVMALDPNEKEPVNEQATDTPASDGPSNEKKKVDEQAPDTPELDFSVTDIRVGVFVEAWEHPDSEKLWCEKIDVGEYEPRQIVSGLRAHYSLEELENRRCLVVCNLKSAKLGGVASDGMVLCGKGEDGKTEFLEPPEDAPIGQRVYCEGMEGTALTPNQVKKKKAWVKVQPFLKVVDGIGTFNGSPILTTTGACKTPTVRSGTIS